MLREVNFGELNELYRETLLDHSRRPRNCGLLPDADIYAEGNIPLCGDEISIQIKLDGQRCIRDIGFQGKGCAISLASASLMTDLVKGKTLDQVEILTELFNKMMFGKALTQPELEQLGELEALRGVQKFPVRIKCALLAWSAVKEGISGHKAKNTR